MALETYRKKRDFKATPEPRGRQAARANDSFVIQKHDARRLHYDFRLEMDGVLKSWAVTRGPSLVPGEKRLAVHVEDHPLEYGDFEGTIPKGEYGGGTVIVWDRGHWEPIGDAHKGYAKGHLEFELHGEKLSGRWHLIRMGHRPREKKENWLLIKGDDEAARSEGTPDILEERPESVKTGRVVAEVAGEEPGWSKKGPIGNGKPAQTKQSKAKQAPAKRHKEKAPPAEAQDEAEAPDPARIDGAKKAPLPRFVEPALASLSHEAPGGDRWIHEIKFDGYRLQARLEAGRVKLLTRGGLDWTLKFGKEIQAAFKRLPVGNALLDGEVVVENESGASQFSSLQTDLSAGRTDRFVFYAFDLLHLDGYDLRESPLIARKQALERLISDDGGLLRYSIHFETEGSLVWRHACRLSLEGVVSKLRDGTYHSGRTRGWLKSKCATRQEFVIAGYVPSSVSRQAIGSLVLGYYEGDALVHVGRAGTGYTAAVAKDLHQRLERIRVPSSPFAKRLAAEASRQVRYVKPQFVADVEFRGWTADNHLRQAAFRGLREDKSPRDVVRETPAGTVAAAPRPAIDLTHPDRLYWPEAGVTKAGLADYYVEVWRRMAPFVVARPLALLRCPDGITGQCFFQKHAWRGLSRSIHLMPDPADAAEEPLLTIDDLDGLIALVQSGVLEIHPWGAAMASLEQPDMLIMDLDPGEGVAWEDVIAAALEVRERLTKLGLASFVKTSGGKGLHVVAPLRPKAGWDEVKTFSKTIAEAMASDTPGRFVSTITKSKRGGKILVDYLRNGRGNTAVAPYSTRARPGAPVSMPLGWEELDNNLGPTYFTVANAVTRLTHVPTDPWGEFRKAATPLPRPGARKRKAAA